MQTAGRLSGQAPISEWCCASSVRVSTEDWVMPPRRIVNDLMVGVHISKVKSTTLDHWNSDTIQVFEMSLLMHVSLC
jgi:hypothetical protein